MLNSHATPARRRGAFATLLSLVASAVGAALYRHRARRVITHLESLDDRLLKDMGITRADLRSAATRGVMPGE
ncbi:MAG TPA: DUF1127 domain-containing protein [Azospirillum sp.]|nr:DUF1127 domain-containing protein [Azospirillum sp.]